MDLRDGKQKEAARPEHSGRVGCGYWCANPTGVLTQLVHAFGRAREESPTAWAMMCTASLLLLQTRKGSPMLPFLSPIKQTGLHGVSYLMYALLSLA